MRPLATHRLSPVLLVLTLATAGCPFSEGGGIDLDRAILVNDAADSVLGTIADAVEGGNFEIDDAKVALIVTPDPGAVVPRATPLTFAWALPSGGKRAARRGSTTSGEFVWL